MGDSFEVFLSHNSSDKPAVEEIARKLMEGGLRPWLDKWNLIPGQPWQEAIEDALRRCASCVVFIGPSGIGPWQNEEMRAAVDRRVSGSTARFPVVPVLLPGGRREERSRLPTFLVATTWVEFKETLDDEEALYRLTCGIRGIEPGERTGAVASTGECPYRGLNYFDVEHAQYFLGREALTEWLLHELRPLAERDDRTRFLGMIGPSGSGKSSLARAGLLAALKRGALPGSSEWPIVICRPGADPIENLAFALADQDRDAGGSTSIHQIMKALAESPRALHLFARQALRQQPAERRFVLLVDAFEEMFTLAHDEKARAAVIDNLMHAATVTGGQVIVLLTLRADFYGECSAHPTLAAALSEHQVLVGPMDAAQLLRSIERPAQMVGCECEPGLAATLVEEVRDQPGGLPLLEYTLSELWNRRQGRRLTHSAYQAIGRLVGALEQRADQVFEEFSEAEKLICRRIFMRLVQPGDEGKLTRRRARLSELTPEQSETSPSRKVIDILAGPAARLITVETQTAAAAGAGVATQQLRRNAQYVEVAHEALIRSWGRLQRWLQEDQEFQLWQKRLRYAMEGWERTNRDPESLLRRLSLEEARRWKRERDGDLNREEREFIAASDGYDRIRKEEEEERQRAFAEEQQQRLEAETARADAERAGRLAEEKRAEAEKQSARKARLAVAALAGLLLTVLTGSALSWSLSKRSRAKDMADQARGKGSVELALLALKEGDVPQARGALYETARQNVAALTSDSAVNDVAFNASRTFAATAHADGTVRLWKSAGAQPALWNVFSEEGKFAHPKEVVALAFHPREDLLATGTLQGDAVVRIWRIGSVTPEWQSSPQGEDINAVGFNRTGVLVAAASRSGKLTVWNRETNAVRSINPPHQATSLAFAPTEDRLAAGCADGTVIWWNVASDSPDSVPGEDRRGKVHDLAISPDGKSLALATQRGLWVWRTGSGQAPAQAAVRGEPLVTFAVAISPQGDLIAAADADGGVSIVNASSMKEELRIAVPGLGRLTAVAFQPDPGGTGSRKLAVAGSAGSARIYELNVALLVKSLETR